MRRFLSSIVGVLAACSMALANDDKVNLGRLAWTAFQCASYAEMASLKEEQARLFQIGYAAGKEFVEGIENKTIPEDEIKQAPWFLLVLLGGPSIDFMIGRIFQFAAEQAHDNVTKLDTNGIPLEASRWVTDETLKTIIAKNKYNSSNCELIR